MSTPCILTIGGLDPSGGAGLPADARAVAAFGGHACGIATAVVAQNTCGVLCIEPVSENMLAAQMDNLLEDITPRAVKIGLLPNVAAVKIVAERIKFLQSTPIVIDTVFAPSSGPAFSDESTIAAVIEHLLPLCDFMTPNIPETERLLNTHLSEWNAVREAAGVLQSRFGAQNVLLKGGHWDGENSVDLFCDGERLIELKTPRVHGYEVRGTGCLLASAIAAKRARGALALEAAQQAKIWLNQKIRRAQAMGQGRRVVVR